MSVKESKNFSKDKNMSELLYGENGRMDIRIPAPLVKYFNKYCEDNNIGKTKCLLSLVSDNLPNSLEEYLGTKYYNSLCLNLVDSLREQANSNSIKNFALYLIQNFLNVSDEDFARNIYSLLDKESLGKLRNLNHFINTLTAKKCYIVELKNLIKNDKEIKAKFNEDSERLLKID